jgi:hypothetical protein
LRFCHALDFDGHNVQSAGDLGKPRLDGREKLLRALALTLLEALGSSCPVPQPQREAAKDHDGVGGSGGEDGGDGRLHWSSSAEG